MQERRARHAHQQAANIREFIVDAVRMQAEQQAMLREASQRLDPAQQMLVPPVHPLEIQRILHPVPRVNEREIDQHPAATITRLPRRRVHAPLADHRVPGMQVSVAPGIHRAPVPPIEQRREDPVRRVESFLESEIGLDLWYGMFRRPYVATIPFRNAVGFEMALLCEVAFGGKIETVSEAFCVRGIPAVADSESEAAEEPAAEFDVVASTGNALGVPDFQLGDPYLVLAVQLFCNIAFLSDNFAALPKIDRLRLAVRAYTRVAERYGIADEGQFISFAVRIYPEARITEKLHEVRHYLSATLYSQKESKAVFEPLSRAEDIINGLCRLKIGRLPATQKEREIVVKIRDRFDKSKSEAFKNRAILALALYL